MTSFELTLFFGFATTTAAATSTKCMSKLRIAVKASGEPSSPSVKIGFGVTALNIVFYMQPFVPFASMRGPATNLIERCSSASERADHLFSTVHRKAWSPMEPRAGYSQLLNFRTAQWQLRIGKQCQAYPRENILVGSNPGHEHGLKRCGNQISLAVGYRLRHRY